MTVARRPFAREVDAFAFDDAAVNETLVRDLAGGAFLEQPRNLVLIGGTGAGETEFGFHEFTTSLASSYDRWSTEDFWDHYRNGNGRAVSLLEIGHLREIAEQYAYDDGIEGAFRRLADQIADEARKGGSRNVTYEFEFVYDFGSVDFAHGDGTVRGVFVGSVTRNGPMMIINGDTRFEFHDIFQDPFDVGVEAGVPYRIFGDWTARFSAEVFARREDSNFFQGPRSD